MGAENYMYIFFCYLRYGNYRKGVSTKRQYQEVLWGDETLLDPDCGSYTNTYCVKIHTALHKIIRLTVS